MDLTKSHPRSVHEKVLGIVQLGRAIDKGKAQAYGNVGEYHYNCPMDQAVFAFLRINGDELLEVIKNAKSDDEIYAYLRPLVEKKSAAEIDRWNREWVTSKPEGKSLEFFMELRNTIAPERTDITSWADLLDLDERRHVPKRQRIAA